MPSVVSVRSAEDAMHARVWQQEGYRGALALCSGKLDSPDVTLVALWDSLETIRASEDNLFLIEAISRYLVCCEGLPHITEQELLVSDFSATSARAI